VARHLPTHILSTMMRVLTLHRRQLLIPTYSLLHQVARGPGITISIHMGNTKGLIIHSKDIHRRARECTTDLRVACHPRVTMPMVGGKGGARQEAYLQDY